jgi:NAD(P)-dependent dehydrogenase (short-subunit alcohol dehydrogenase family)
MAYAASKAGMVAMSRTIARGYGKKGIKSFVIAPGFVKTDMSANFIETYGEDYVKGDLALNSLTLPDDVAPTVVFLLSGLADHATGSTIDINAGSYVH